MKSSLHLTRSPLLTMCGNPLKKNILEGMIGDFHALRTNQDSMACKLMITDKSKAVYNSEQTVLQTKRGTIGDWFIKSFKPLLLATALTVTLTPVAHAFDLFKSAEQKAAEARYRQGKALFEQKCKTETGYKIYKVVEDVEGIQLLKIRHRVQGDMNAPGAAFAKEVYDESYLSSFLGYETTGSLTKEQIASGRRNMISTTYNPGDQPGYRYVDVIDEKDGKRYRYVGRWEELWLKDKRYLKGDIHFFLDHTLASDPAPRYAVTFEDHVIPEERALGLASSTVKVLDTQTGEVLGEMLRYAWSPGKPSSYNPIPWETAYACPGNPTASGNNTRLFVDQVLIPKGSIYREMKRHPIVSSKK